MQELLKPMFIKTAFIAHGSTSPDVLESLLWHVLEMYTSLVST
jgi:hypothetical protein